MSPLVLHEDPADRWEVDWFAQFFVQGIPKPQGSKRAIMGPNQKFPSIVESSGLSLKDWRHDVRLAVYDYMSQHDLPMLVEQPIATRLRFVMKRGLSLSKTKPTPPCIGKVGDIEKCARALYDAFTGVVYDDDSRVIKEDVTQRIAERGEQPGCWITIGQVRWAVE